MSEIKTTTSYKLDSISPIAHPRSPPITPLACKDGMSKPALEYGNEPTDPETSDNGEKDRSKFRITMILLALFLSLFIAALDATIVATAIPTITSDLKSPSGYAWIGGAYLIANAAGAPIWAKLSDIWGRKPILLAAVALFIASSIICALAVDMKMLIAGRAVQGSAGGGLIMMVNIVISDIFSMRRRSLFLGLCEGVWCGAGAIGPILGGVLTDLANWRWCWWINLPCCGLAFVLILFYLDVHNPRTPLVAGVKAIDWAGSLSILALTLLLLLGLDFGGDTFPWSSPKVICLIVFGALCSLLFIYAEKRWAKYPLIPLCLFSERSNIASLLVTFFHAIAFIPAEYYFPLYLQSAKSASPLRSGILLVPLITMTATCGVLTGVFIHRFGRYRELIWIGTVFLTLGNGAYISLNANSGIAHIIGVQLLGGFGAGLQFEPPLVALQAFCAQDDVATATSTFSFIRSMALSISVILGGVVFQNSMDTRRSSLVAAGIPPNITALLTGKEAAAHVMIPSTLSDPVQREAAKQAFAWSMRNMWIMYTCFSFLGIVSGLFVKRRILSREHKETVTGLKEEVREVVPLVPDECGREREGERR
jgi:EmrB/QacA subfamily drug resistance transporter